VESNTSSLLAKFSMTVPITKEKFEIYLHWLN